MLRHPAGILSLVLVMLAVATVVGGVASGTWGLDHVRGASLLPTLMAAMLMVVIAGPRRGIVALVAELTAIVCVAWALNHLRLIVKWQGHDLFIEQCLSGVQAAGFLVAAGLLMRSRPAAEPGDWHRPSAIMGAGLWFVGLRAGPGSRAGLGLAAMVFVAALSLGGFEKAREAPALTQTLERFIEVPKVDPRPAGGDARESTGWAGDSPVVDRAERPRSAATETDAREAAETSPSSDSPGWYVPIAERRLPASAAISSRPPAERVNTRIAPSAKTRQGPWAGVLSDRPLGRRPSTTPTAPAARVPLGEPITATTPKAAVMRPASHDPLAPEGTGPDANDSPGIIEFIAAPPGPLSFLEMGPFSRDPADSNAANAANAADLANAADVVDGPVPVPPVASPPSVRAPRATPTPAAAASVGATQDRGPVTRDEDERSFAARTTEARPGWSSLVGSGARITPGRPTAVTAAAAPTRAARVPTTTTPAPSRPTAPSTATSSWATLDRIGGPATAPPAVASRQAPRSAATFPAPAATLAAAAADHTPAASQGWTGRREASATVTSMVRRTAVVAAAPATSPGPRLAIGPTPTPADRSPAVSRPATDANTAWTDPQVLLAADAGAAGVSRRSPALLAGIGAVVIVVLAVLARSLAAGRRGGAATATGTTDTA